ncbi:MAG: HAD-IC family P-type ATPase, partial [Elusimicrobia bacterium]|nr:HAD-IC family P-type ATPase [Elusimicrobiota bacterium]
MTTPAPTMMDRLRKLGDEKPGVTPEAAQGEQELLEIAGLAPEAVLAKLQTGDKGLAADSVAERRERFGPNMVGGARKLGLLGELYQRAKNPLVVQLLVIALVSLAMGDMPSFVVVGLMVVLSVILAYVQEAQSNKAVERLLAMVKTTCTVLRAGKEAEIPLHELVPGDVVVLAAGSIIPADLRLLTAKDFFVSQSALTGESLPIEKNAAACENAGKGALDLPN